MKGKKQFLKSEIEQIRILIGEKCLSNSATQKKIRQQIRNLGFYYSDYSKKRNGYTVDFFNSLIEAGVIKCSK